MPRAPYRTEAMLGRAAPTNQWYSTLIFNPKPETIYAQPLSFKRHPAGLEIALPKKVVVRPSAGTSRSTTRTRIRWWSRRSPSSPVAPSWQASDWAIDISMARGADHFDATVAHGSPYA